MSKAIALQVAMGWVSCWVLEEFRVLISAQQRKTAYPVSAKRMDKLWDKRVGLE